VFVAKRAAVEASSERRDMLGCKQVSIAVAFRVSAVTLCVTESEFSRGGQELLSVSPAPSTSAKYNFDKSAVDLH
jgi:hypothetical protein